MIKVHIIIKNQQIIFDEYVKDTKNIDINNTNMFNNNDVVFDEEYICKNINLVSSFLNIIVTKNKINIANIVNKNVCLISIFILNTLPNINVLNITYNEIVNFETYELLIKNRYLKYLNCYNIPKFMFEELNKRKGFTIDIRNEIISFSEFMESNQLNTYSNIYYKHKIKINSSLDTNDINDLDIFFKINNNLKYIDISYYSKNNIQAIYDLICKNKNRNITVNILQNEKNINSINADVDFLKIIQKKFKKYNCNIKLIYSNEYKHKNILKQVNISFLKILAVFIILISTTGYVAAKYINDKNSKDTEKIKKEVTKVKDEQQEDVQNTEQTVEDTSTTEEKKGLSQDFSELLSINSETIGWIKVNNTNVDYPVVKHSDNDYYLNKDFYNNNNINGWIYMDYRNSPDNLSDNTILYGHTNYTDYSLMFGSLINTTKESWYTNDANTYITFNTLNGNHQFKIFSIYIIDVTNDYLVSDFKSELNHQNFINTITSRSIYNFNTPVSTNDRILTLSTCYNKGNQRLVIHAKMIN